MPSSFPDAIADALPSPPRAMHSVAGGDIAAAYRVETGDGTGALFAKTLAEPPPGFFRAEARGLELLRAGAAGGGVPVPKVVAVTGDAIVLEWIDHGSASPDAAEEFGRHLARTHASGAEAFGSPDGSDGFIGSLPLPGGPWTTWSQLWAQGRVRPYLRAASDTGSVSDRDRRDIEAVLDRLDDLAGTVEPPALIHGDLWGGNVLWSATGTAYLIDPAAHGGHRETDLAMLALFGLPYLDRALAAYDEVTPLADGWRDRIALHQLHPVLVHAVLFGGSYGARAGELARQALRH